MKTLKQLFGRQKILSIVLCILVAVALIVPTTALYASSASVTLTPEDNYITPGTAFDVELVLSCDTEVTGWSADIQFDASKLTYNSFTPSSFLDSPISVGTIQHDDVAGTVTNINFATTGTPSAATSGAVLGTLNFTAKTGVSGEASIGFTTLGIADSLGNPYTTITPVDGSVDIVDVLPPVISSIDPASAGNGDTVTITGLNLTGATSVTLGGVEATNVTVINDTTVTAKVAAGATGDVVITTLGGNDTLTAGFTYIAATIDDTINPVQGGPGTVVTLTGTHLINTSTVIFGGTGPAYSDGTSVTPQTKTAGTVTVVVPNMGGSNITGVSLHVVTPDGILTPSGTFDYQAAGITGFTPASGYAGDSITITGLGFSGATSVKIGGVNAANYTVNSDTQITAVVGVGASGHVEVVNGLDITVTSTASFTYKAVSVAIAPSTQTIVENEGEFSVAVIVNTNGSKEIRGWSSDITFDPTLVECLGIEQGTGDTDTGFFATFIDNLPAGASAGSIQSGGAPVINNATGVISNIAYAVGGALASDGSPLGASGSGTLLTINFKAKDGVVGSLDITPVNVLLADQNGNPVLGTLVSDGYVNLLGVIDEDITIDGSLGAQITFIAPSSISGWNLKVSDNNNVQRTMNVFANTDWQVTVNSDNTTGGYMTKWDGSDYVTSTQLSNPLSIKSSIGNGGTGNNISLDAGGVLASGNPEGQNTANGGDIRDIMFNQAVEYVDPIVNNPYTYHIVVTFTASNVSY